MIPVSFPQENAVLGYGQDEYQPLPVHLTSSPDGRMTMCFRLSPAEIEEIVRTKTLWVMQLTFGHSFQPIACSTQRPEHLP